MVLRIEDLDHPKVKPGASAQAVEDLRWLGLDWDEGPDKGGPHSPYVQTERKKMYAEALEKLIAEKLVYPCVCARSGIEAVQSAPHSGENGLYYGGNCRGRFGSYDEAAAFRGDGTPPVWRFMTPPGETVFTDMIAGVSRADVSRETGDFALARDPGGAGYMLAVVVDDAAMGVTQVVRGDDLLPATHRQIHLQRALGLPVPEYAHVPLVVAGDGRRLAKRHGDTRISAFRSAGFTPEEITGLLAYWCGLADKGAHVHPCELIKDFSFEKLSRDRSVYTPDSLLPFADRK